MKQSVKRNLGVFAMVIALFVSSSVFAQPSGSGPQRGQQGPPPVPTAKQIKKMVAEVSKELSLSEEQESKVSKMYVSHFDEVKELTSSGRPDRTKMEALKNQFEKDVKSILTTEQQKLFTAYQKKAQQQMGGQRPQR